jgi:hypothetical protein
MKNEMLSLAEASARITAGDIMTVAGSADLLAALPKGNWIGGTTVYFVTEQGGAVVRDKLFCTTFTSAVMATPRHVPTADLPKLPQGYIEGGFSLILIPAFSAAHAAFAVEGQTYDGLFDQPLAGWVTGVHLDDIGKVAPLVFDGQTGQSHADGAALLHLALPPGAEVELDILNIFAQSDAAELTFAFDKGGFAATTAQVNGAEVNLGKYIEDHKIDTRLPLIANYAGALINVSVQSIDAATGEVKFYAPLVEGVEYRLARSLTSYALAFAEGAAGGGEGQYSCNCILNYIYGEMQGTQTGKFTGPVTFGEIAYILLNQTLVRLDVKLAA